MKSDRSCLPYQICNSGWWHLSRSQYFQKYRKQTDPRPSEIRQLPRVLLSQNTLSRSGAVQRYYDKSHQRYLRHLPRPKFFLTRIFLFA